MPYTRKFMVSVPAVDVKTSNKDIMDDIMRGADKLGWIISIEPVFGPMGDVYDVFTQEYKDATAGLHGAATYFIDAVVKEFGYALQMKHDVGLDQINDPEAVWIPEVTEDQMKAVLKGVLDNMLDNEFDR